MERKTRSLEARPWTALACLVGLLAMGTAPMAAGQVGVYTIEGQVLDPGGDPTADAQVELARANSSEPARTTRSADDGTYRFRNVEEGRWDLTAQHPCCGPAYRNVTVSGTQLVHEVDLQLTRQDDARGEDVVIVRGHTVERDDPAPAPNVALTVENRYEGDGEESKTRYTVRSDAEGAYAIEVRPGWVHLTARGEGYEITEGGFAVEADRMLDIPMRSTDEQAVRLSGTLSAPNGTAIAHAHVQVEPDRTRECRENPCAESMPARGGEHVEHDGVDWWIRPAADPHASTRTDEGGRWQLTTREGQLRVSARAEGFLPREHTLAAEAGEDRTVNLTLEPIPPDSVTLTGTITDADDGEPVPQARVSVENQAWGAYETTRTDANGTYRLEVKPGYTILTVEAEERYVGACTPHNASTASSQDGPGQGDEPARESASTTPARAEPLGACGVAQREHAYRPQAVTLVPQADETRTLDVTLERVPAPSATLEGWLVNASSEEGIPNATVSLVNEDTGARGRAQADEDGSFTIDVPSGYYTVRARAEGYYHAVENVLLAEDETRQIAVEMTPGKARPYRCCIVYEGAVTAEDARSEGTAGADAEQSTRSDQPRGAAGASTAPEVFEGQGGGLGPYQAHATDDRGDAAAPAPGVGAWGALGLVGLAAILSRRRSPARR